MVTCRKEEADAASQEKREPSETGKVVIVHRSVEPEKATPSGLVDESKEHCTGPRRA